MMTFTLTTEHYYHTHKKDDYGDLNDGNWKSFWGVFLNGKIFVGT